MGGCSSESAIVSDAAGLLCTATGMERCAWSEFAESNSAASASSEDVTTRKMARRRASARNCTSALDGDDGVDLDKGTAR